MIGLDSRPPMGMAYWPVPLIVLLDLDGKLKHLMNHDGNCPSSCKHFPEQQELPLSRGNLTEIPHRGINFS